MGALLMIEITPSLQIDERELQIDFVRASGPGGQNVNKVATAAQLRFDVNASSLPEEVKARLLRLAGNRITTEGILLIEAKRFRTQEQNREDAVQRSRKEPRPHPAFRSAACAGRRSAQQLAGDRLDLHLHR